MKDSPTSLDRLHDLSPPPEVPWWPLAPGWHVVLGLVLLIVATISYQGWRRWKSNAYRRAALKALEHATSTSEIATLLRRTSLAIAPRHLIANMNGPTWTRWLSSLAAKPIPEELQSQLTDAIYAPACSDTSPSALRAYASYWVRNHRVDDPSPAPTHSAPDA